VILCSVSLTLLQMVHHEQSVSAPPSSTGMTQVDSYGRPLCVTSRTPAQISGPRLNKRSEPRQPAICEGCRSIYESRHPPASPGSTDGYVSLPRVYPRSSSRQPPTQPPPTLLRLTSTQLKESRVYSLTPASTPSKTQQMSVRQSFSRVQTDWIGMTYSLHQRTPHESQSSLTKRGRSSRATSVAPSSNGSYGTR